MKICCKVKTPYSIQHFILRRKKKIFLIKEGTTMQVKFKGCKTGQKINISMVIPTGEQKTVITMEMPQGGDWRADMECYDKVLSAYEERLDKAMQIAQLQQAEEAEQLA
jgi:hypothetical protein